MLPLGVWVVVIVAMRSEGVDPKSMEGVLVDLTYHLAADHHIHHLPRAYIKVGCATCFLNS